MITRKSYLSIFVFVFLFFLVFPAFAMQESYGYNECEKIAKDFRHDFGGSLVFIQPLTKNGVFDFGEYNGHWINAKYISGNHKTFFFDYGNSRIFSTKKEIKAWYLYQTGQDSEIYIVGVDHIPFPLIYHN